MTSPAGRRVRRHPEPSLDSLPTRWSRAWAVIVLFSTVAAAVLSLTGAPEIVRAPVLLWFLAVCPGMALVRLLRLGDPLVDLALAIGLSLALAGLVPGIFLYLGAWSPAWSLTILILISLGALAADPVVVPRQGWRTLGHAVRERIRVFAGQADPATPGASPLQSPRPLGYGEPIRMASPTAAVETPRRKKGASAPDVADLLDVPAAERRNERPAARRPRDGAMRHDETSAALRSTFDRVIGDIAEQRQRDG